jgi:hypothetical protein
MMEGFGYGRAATEGCVYHRVAASSIGSALGAIRPVNPDTKLMGSGPLLGADGSRDAGSPTVRRFEFIPSTLHR